MQLSGAAARKGLPQRPPAVPGFQEPGPPGPASGEEEQRREQRSDLPAEDVPPPAARCAGCSAKELLLECLQPEPG